MIRRSGRVVEGGTLLRCYTSQRGIEGSNPSSSAPKVACLQHKPWRQDKGWSFFRPLLHQRVHQRSQSIPIRGHECRSRNREDISTATRNCSHLCDAAQARSAQKCLCPPIYKIQNANIHKKAHSV